jgi:hypothetical protein
MVLAAAFPVQLCGPLSVTVPSVPTLPLKPSNGAANESVQSCWDTIAFMPTSEASQCFVTAQVPVMSGHAALPAPPLDPDGVPAESEPQAQTSNARTKEIFPIVAMVTAHPRRIIEADPSFRCDRARRM